MCETKILSESRQVSSQTQIQINIKMYPSLAPSLAPSLVSSSSSVQSPPLCSIGGATPCLGVPGNPAALGDNYTSFFNYYGNASSVAPCLSTTVGEAPSVSQFGCCINGNANKSRGSCSNPLKVDGETLASGKFPCSLVALTKSWGVTSTWQHGGVVAENVSIVPNVLVNYEGSSSTQNVIRLRITGDEIDDPTAPAGIFNVHTPHATCKQGACYDSSGTPTTPCTEIECTTTKRLTKENIQQSPKEGGAGFTYSNPQARVGACIATSNQFGPGRYSILARLPKTSWAETDGRGYVFAMWTFAYTEQYNVYPNGEPSGGFGNNLGSYDASPPANVHGKTPPPLPSIAQGSDNDGWFTVTNHEIDIEIPANSPQLAGSFDDWKANLTWKTMNCNTWLSDIDKYEGTDPYYTQAMTTSDEVQSDVKSFVSENGEFHWYEFEWTVYPDDPSKNTVTWYFDGDVVYSTNRFVPFYSGRLVIGPWPAWWGCGKQSPQFATADIDIAQILIEPQASPKVNFSIGQMYDQVLPTTGGPKDLACGFQGWEDCVGSSPCFAPPPPPPPIPYSYYCSPNHGCKMCEEGGCPSGVTLYPNLTACAPTCASSPPPPKSQWYCEGGCEGVSPPPQGVTTYSTQELCLNACGKYYCDSNHQCREVTGAKNPAITYFVTLDQCDAHCAPSQKETWIDRHKWFLIGVIGGVIFIMFIVILALALRKRSGPMTQAMPEKELVSRQGEIP